MLTPEFCSVRVTATPGIAPPCWSFTVPTSDEYWAAKGRASRNRNTTTRLIKLVPLCIVCSPRTMECETVLESVWPSIVRKSRVDNVGKLVCTKNLHAKTAGSRKSFGDGFPGGAFSRYTWGRSQIHRGGETSYGKLRSSRDTRLD